MSLAAYEAEDGLVSHQQEERLCPWSYESSMHHYRGMPGPGSARGGLGSSREGGRDREFLKGKLGKWITFEM